MIRLLCFAFLILAGNSLMAQTTIFFQGFEGSLNDTWAITGSWERNDQGGVSVNNQRTGNFSARIGRGTGGSGAPGGISNGPHTLTMSAVNLTAYSGVTVILYTSTAPNFGSSGHGTGTGLDNNEQVTVQFRLNSGAWTTYGRASGTSNYTYGWSTATVGSGSCGYTMPNALVYSVPAGTNTLELRVFSATTCAATTGNNYDRADEGIYIDDIEITATSTTLPLELLDFNASATQNIVNTQWTTASEENTEFHIVERSGNAFDFYEIGRLQAAGYSSHNITYVWKDDSPLKGTSYYRLKTIDFDGYISYSNIVAIQHEGSKNISVFYNAGNVFFQSQNNESLSLYNASGALVKVLQAKTGEIILLDGIEKGIYYLKANTGIEVLKVLVR